MPRVPKSALALALTACLAACVPPKEPAATPALATALPVVGGATMYPDRTIAQNAASSKDHTVLMSAVDTAALRGTLSGAGPFTIFAPTNAAFARLPPTTVETLMHPSNRPLLSRILNYHIVPGRKTRAEIIADIRAGGGTATYRTAAGMPIRVRMEGSAIALWDAYNNKSVVRQADALQSNGVLHVVDSVLLPTIGA